MSNGSSCSFIIAVGFHLCYPVFTLLQHLMSLQPKVFVDDLTETGCRVSELFQHGPPDSCLSDVGIVFSGTCRTRWGSSRSFISWLVKIGLWYQNQGLNRNQYLQRITTHCRIAKSLYRKYIQDNSNFKTIEQINLQCNLKENFGLN